MVAIVRGLICEARPGAVPLYGGFPGRYTRSFACTLVGLCRTDSRATQRLFSRSARSVESYLLRWGRLHAVIGAPHPLTPEWGTEAKPKLERFALGGQKRHRKNVLFLLRLPCLFC
jgi:hypothetical protein